MNFEDDLRAALQRQPAPSDFAVKVLARALIEEKAKVVTLPVWRRPAVWAIAAGIAITALLPPAVLEYRHQQELRAREARRELVFALNITRAQLRQTRDRVHRATARHTL